MGAAPSKRIEQVFKFGTITLLNKTDSVEEINNYFATVGERGVREIDYVPFKILDEKVIDTEMSFFNEITITRFLEIVSDMKTTKSSGIEDLNSCLVIKAMKIMPQVFVHICNRSLKEGIFPQDCKEARISVIPKKGDLRLLDNIRPM